ncbi:unnamed protein product, partial [Staurois parvus]
MSAASGHPCSMPAASGHLLYMSAVSGHLLYCVHSLWSSPVLWPQSLVISCTVSALSGHFLYYVCSPLVQNFFFFISSS